MRSMLRIAVTAAAVIGAVLLPSAASAIPPVPIPPAPSLVVNGSFENGLANWSCEDARTVQAPHTGEAALAGVTSHNSTGRCTQTIAVNPGTALVLSAWVQGAFAQLGVTGHGSATTVTGASAWTFAQKRFTTGPDTRTVEIFVSGWYVQGPYRADVVTVGALRSVPPPGTPGDLRVVGTTSRTVSLSWTAVPGAAGYRVRDAYGVLRDTGAPVTTTAVTVGAGTTTTLRVTAYHALGESAPSAPVTATTPADADSVPYAPRSVVVEPGPGTSLWVAWEAVQTASAGYAVYVDGVRVATTVGPATYVQGLAPDRTYRVEVTALNTHGESPRSFPRHGTTDPLSR
jgi:hypothetical protein